MCASGRRPNWSRYRRSSGPTGEDCLDMSHPLESLGPIARTETCDIASGLAPAIDAAREHLLGLQSPEGYWVGELEADSTLESDYIQMEYFLRNPHPEKIRKAAQHILDKQLPEGGWNIFEGGPPNIS